MLYEPETIDAQRLYLSMVDEECEDLTILSVNDLKADGILVTDYTDKNHADEINNFILNVFPYNHLWLVCDGEEYIVGERSDYEYYLKHGKGINEP